MWYYRNVIKCVTKRGKLSMTIEWDGEYENQRIKTMTESLMENNWVGRSSVFNVGSWHLA